MVPRLNHHWGSTEQASIASSRPTSFEYLWVVGLYRAPADAKCRCWPLSRMPKLCWNVLNQGARETTFAWANAGTRFCQIASWSQLQYRRLAEGIMGVVRTPPRQQTTAKKKVAWWLLFFDMSDWIYPHTHNVYPWWYSIFIPNSIFIENKDSVYLDLVCECIMSATSRCQAVLFLGKSSSPLMTVWHSLRKRGTQAAAYLMRSGTHVFALPAES